MTEQNELLAFIQARNNETAAWIAEAEGRWAGFIPEDLEFWAEHGVTTVREYEEYTMRATYSDLYKDVMGVRPHHAPESYEELCKSFDSLVDMLNEQNERDKFYAEEAAAAAEAEIECYISYGAKDREEAARWIEQARAFDAKASDYFPYSSLGELL